MLKLMEAKRLNLAVLLSGRGSNFLALLRAGLNKELNAAIAVVITDNPDAVGYQKALEAGIPAYVIQRGHFQSKAEFEQKIIHKLQEANTDMVVLAGFMRIIGKTLIQAYPNRILNIHPSLLPAFPGLNAQKQAWDYGVRYSGCTVHLVDEGMDTGPIVAQAAVPVLPQDTEDTLSERILETEHKLYAQAVQLFAEGRVHLQGRKVYIQE